MGETYEHMAVLRFQFKCTTIISLVRHIKYSDTHEVIIQTLYLNNSVIGPLFPIFHNVYMDNDS